VAAQQDRQGAAPFELLDLPDNLVQGDFVAEISINGVKTGRSAGGIVRLGFNFQMELFVHFNPGSFL
jgi:hypothetical protein